MSFHLQGNALVFPYWVSWKAEAFCRKENPRVDISLYRINHVLWNYEVMDCCKLCCIELLNTMLHGLL